MRTAATSAVILPTGAPIVTGEAAGRYVQGNLRVTKPAVSGTTPVSFGNSAIINPQGNALGTVTVNRAAGLHVADVTYGQNPASAQPSPRLTASGPSRPKLSPPPASPPASR